MSGTTQWYGITSQKTWILNTADVKTSNSYNHKIHYLPVMHLQELAPVVEVKVAMETSARSVEEAVLSFSAEQRLLLDQHLRKHVQLTTQHFLQTYAHPQLSNCAAECHGIIVSCSRFLFNCCVNLMNSTQCCRVNKVFWRLHGEFVSYGKLLHTDSTPYVTALSWGLL
jgi:hypothetical protein